MSKYAIKIEKLSKKFQRFSSPGWSAINALGLYVPKSKYDMFDALSDVSFTVKPGERVALIGRNGAGKSTLLRQIAGMSKPTSGDISVFGKVQALMELGSGFHPDFTGVDNIIASLAYHGISQSKAKDYILEITDFTELGEAINRPVREYSAGMYARLAFAVSTSISPEILIIDEILGAGDAYFTGKCIQRMKKLTSGGTTVLFVSHDISAVQMLCDRAIWLQNGRVIRDGPTLPVGKAYSAAVREDEELRLRAQHSQLTKQQVKNIADTQSSLYRLVSSEGGPPKTHFYVSEIRYGVGEMKVGAISPLCTGSENESNIILDETYMNWRLSKTKDQNPTWVFGDFGALYKHAPWKIYWPHQKNDLQRWIEIDYLPSIDSEVLIEEFSEAKSAFETLKSVPPSTEGKNLQTIRVEIPDKLEKSDNQLGYDLQDLSKDERYGSGDIVISKFGFFDSSEEKRHTLISGEDSFALMHYKAYKTIENPVAVIAIYKPDGSCAMQVFSNRNGKDLGKLSGEGAIKFHFSPLFLGEGDYIVSVALFKELNLSSREEPFSYDLHDRCYKLKIMPPEGVLTDLGTVNQPISWELLK